MNHSGNNAALTHRQQMAVAEILTSRSLEEARRSLRAAKGTFYGWLKEPGFQVELRRQRKTMVELAFDRLQYALGVATDKLLELVQTETAQKQHSIQFRAAHALLDHGTKAVELQDLERRLEALEQTSSERRRSWR